MQESPYLEGRGFLVDKLQQLPFLGSVSQKYIKQILPLSKIRTFVNGEIITPEKRMTTGSTSCSPERCGLLKTARKPP